MPVLRLTARVTDLRTKTTVVKSFFRSPVTVGRRPGNTLCLESRKVSAYHGAFAFDRTSLRYVDCNSSNGTVVDDVPVPPEIPLDVRETSVIQIGPFQIKIHLHDVFSVDARGPRQADTPVDTRPQFGGMEQVAAVLATYTQSDALRWIVSQWPPSALLARSLMVFGVFAEVLVEFRPEILTSRRSPLRGAMRAESVMAYLLDPSGGDETLEELLTYLVELLHPGSLGCVCEGRS